jgi:hypothetical protein
MDDTPQDIAQKCAQDWLIIWVCCFSYISCSKKWIIANCYRKMHKRYFLRKMNHTKEYVILQIYAMLTKNTSVKININYKYQIMRLCYQSKGFE